MQVLIVTEEGWFGQSKSVALTTSKESFYVVSVSAFIFFNLGYRIAG